MEVYFDQSNKDLEGCAYERKGLSRFPEHLLQMQEEYLCTSEAEENMADSDESVSGFDDELNEEKEKLMTQGKPEQKTEPPLQKIRST